MSESEGLQKLTEYLKQTRRQAEIAIDNLNNQVISLRHENDELRAVNENLKKEKLQAEAAVQQLKVENTNKWKLRERDEWKALVESLQAERDQLQDECNNLHAKLMTAQSDLEFMRHDMSELSIRYGEVQLSLMEAQSDLAAAAQSQQQKVQRFSNAEDDVPPYSEEKGQTMFTSPVLDRTGRTINFDSYSPTSVAQKLKQELKQANEQVYLLLLIVCVALIVLFFVLCYLAETRSCRTVRTTRKDSVIRETTKTI